MNGADREEQRIATRVRYVQNGMRIPSVDCLRFQCLSGHILPLVFIWKQTSRYSIMNHRVYVMFLKTKT
ncbi:hypothetical protein MKW98_027705 [Papaver atlanticum]|uniref:Uncharacterized protein n=1 Tax=Papaver atlanticum TaxID=357466 RepID=A0AAD4TC79_9MAGN|nr:hypothetical protein MKW98_027705 [Papaver atlanticum]